MAESRIHQGETLAQAEASDDAPISQHTVGGDMPDPSACSSAIVEPAAEEAISAEVARVEEDQQPAVSANTSIGRADQRHALIPSKSAYTDRCKDNVDDTFDRVACRLSKVRSSDVRRRRLKWIGIGLLVATSLGGATVAGMAIHQRPEAPLAWVKEQVDPFLAPLLESWKTDEPVADQS